MKKMYERKEFHERKRRLMKIMSEGMEEEKNKEGIRKIWKKYWRRNKRKTAMGGERIMWGIERRFKKKRQWEVIEGKMGLNKEWIQRKDRMGGEIEKM